LPVYFSDGSVPQTSSQDGHVNTRAGKAERLLLRQRQPKAFTEPQPKTPAQGIVPSSRRRCSPPSDTLYLYHASQSQSAHSCPSETNLSLQFSLAGEPARISATFTFSFFTGHKPASFLDAVLLDQKIICIRDNRRPFDRLFRLGPKMLLHEEQQMKLYSSHVRALPQQGCKNCGLLTIHESPLNPLLTSALA